MNKRFLIVLAGTLAACGAANTSSKDHLSYEATRPLLTLHGPGKQNSIDDLDAVLAALLSSDPHGAPFPLVLYVHGRGNEPRKSFEDTTFTSGAILSKIESDEVRVLGFDWESKAADVRCGRPIDKAQASGPGLASLIRKMQAHRVAHPSDWHGRHVVLLVHSMGSFVLRQALTEPGIADAIRTLFDVRLVSESDAAAGDHASWLPSGAPGITVVLTNPADGTLRRSMKCDKGAAATTDEPRLGLLPASDTSVARLSEATYIELPVGKTHRVFTRGGAAGNPLVCNTVRELMRGSVPKMDAAWEVSGRPNVLRIPEKKSGGDQCNSGSAAEDDDD